MKFLLGTLILFFSFIASAKCISQMSIRSTKAHGDDEIRVSTSRGNFTLDLRRGCWGIDSPWTIIGFETFGSFLCEGDFVLSIDRTTGNVQDRCVIWEIR